MRDVVPPLSLAVGLLFSLSSAACATVDGDAGKVGEIVARSKATTRVYSIYNWNRIVRPDGSVVEEWSAEFNSGSLHRVETPSARIIANCADNTGVYFEPATGRTLSGPEVASVACGVSTRVSFVTQTWLGVADTPFGAANRIRVTDGQLARTYEVSADGIILRSIFTTDTDQHSLTLADIAVACASDLPEGSLFDEPSLRHSFVPARYTAAPDPAVDLSGTVDPVRVGATATEAACFSKAF